MNEKAVAKKEESAIATPQKTIGIPGLEHIPMSILPIPFIKMVHGSSTNVFLKDGSKASPGTFYHVDTKEVEKEIDFALISSRFQKRMVENKRTGKMEQKKFLVILGYDLTEKELFIISLSALSSWRAFGTLMSQIRKAKLRAAWEFSTNLKSVVVTSKNKEEFQAPIFQLGERIAPEDMKVAEKAYTEYGSVLDKSIDEEDGAVEVTGLPNEGPSEETTDPDRAADRKADAAQPEEQGDAPDEEHGAPANPEEEVSPDDIPF